MAIAFTPEDGTGLANASSYADVHDADQYLEDTGKKSVWKAFSTGDRQAALIAATRYMDDNFGDRYLGDIQASTIDTQALLWPRENVPNDRGDVYPASPLPNPVQWACAEYALAFLQGGNSLYGSNQDAGAVVTEKTVRVEGAVFKSEKFGGGGSTSGTRKYPAAMSHLSKVILASSGRLVARA